MKIDFTHFLNFIYLITVFTQSFDFKWLICLMKKSIEKMTIIGCIYKMA